MSDPYKILGLPKNASAEDVKKAYRILVKEYHPDLHPGDSAAAARMSEINAAYDILKSRNFEIYADTEDEYPYDDEYDAGGRGIDIHSPINKIILILLVIQFIVMILGSAGLFRSFL